MAQSWWVSVGSRQSKWAFYYCTYKSTHTKLYVRSQSFPPSSFFLLPSFLDSSIFVRSSSSLFIVHRAGHHASPPPQKFRHARPRPLRPRPPLLGAPWEGPEGGRVRGGLLRHGHGSGGVSQWLRWSVKLMLSRTSRTRLRARYIFAAACCRHTRPQTPPLSHRLHSPTHFPHTTHHLNSQQSASSQGKPPSLTTSTTTAPTRPNNRSTS